MNNEKLEDVKIMSSVMFVIFLIITIIFVAGEIDVLKNGGASVWFFILLFGLAAMVCLIVAIVTSSVLKKRQGELYFSNKMYLEGFLELFFPTLLGSRTAQIRKRNVSDKNKKTRLWKELCAGYDIESIVSFVAWFLLLVGCVKVLIDEILYSEESGLIYITAFSIISIVIVVVLVFVAAGIKKDPTPIFEYMDITKVKFNTLAKHYDDSEKITHRIWIDKEFVFVQSKGKAYCFSVDEYEDMTINFTRLRFVMVLSSTYDCIIQSSLTPLGFLKLKKCLECEAEE